MKIGEKKYNKLMRFFKAVSKNSKDALKESQIYLTQGSIEKNLKIYFGH